MKTEGIIFLASVVLLFFVSILIFRKTKDGKKEKAVPAVLICSLIGLACLGVVFCFKFIGRPIIALNPYTICACIFGSLPALATLLLLNVI